MQVTINGESKTLPGSISIDELLQDLGIEQRVVAVSVNYDIIKRESWSKFLIKENDALELLQFMGGG